MGGIVHFQQEKLPSLLKLAELKSNQVCTGQLTTHHREDSMTEQRSGAPTMWTPFRMRSLSCVCLHFKGVHISGGSLHYYVEEAESIVGTLRSDRIIEVPVTYQRCPTRRGSTAQIISIATSHVQVVTLWETIGTKAVACGIDTAGRVVEVQDK